LNDDVNLSTSHRDQSAAGTPSVNDSASKGINGAGFNGEEVNPSSSRVEVRGGDKEGSGRGSMSYDEERQEVPRRR
jgi:hypothetical protein